MKHYKSWSDLNKKLHAFVCASLKDRITYFLTRYHKVHNSYGRAAILVDSKEFVCFSWIEMYYQEEDVDKMWKETGTYNFQDSVLKEKWDANCTYYEMDFLEAALQFMNMPINEAVESENYIIKIFAIIDRRLGKRTLRNIYNKGEYKNYPLWVKQFYELRFEDL